MEEESKRESENQDNNPFKHVGRMQQAENMEVSTNRFEGVASDEEDGKEDDSYDGDFVVEDRPGVLREKETRNQRRVQQKILKEKITKSRDRLASLSIGSTKQKARLIKVGSKKWLTGDATYARRRDIIVDFS